MIIKGNLSPFFTLLLAVLINDSNAMIGLENVELRSDRKQEHNRALRSEQIDNTDGKELEIKNTPKELNVDPRSTYNEKFMALMNSPCRPEYDGFFGATSGEPIRIQYGFQVEVQPLSAIMDILEAIEDKIVDSILQISFPETCGLQRARKTQELSRILLERSKERNLGIKPLYPPSKNRKRSLDHIDGHPSGFRFLKFEEVEKCLPQENEVNFCGVFTGVLYIYGKHQHGEETSRSIVSQIYEVLDNSEPRHLHSELTLLSSVDKFSVVERDNNQFAANSNNNGVALSRLDILMIIISGLILVAIIYYIYIQRRERKYDNPQLPINDSLRRKRELIDYPHDLSSRISSDSDDSEKDEFIDELNFKRYRDERCSGGVLL
jgi:hypothetical protein